MTFLGHSKGGAEAALNAVKTGRGAILFNPMNVVFSAYGLEQKRKDYAGNMVSYVVKGDLLNTLFGGMSVGKIQYLPTQSKMPWWSYLSPLAKKYYWWKCGIENHDSPGIRAALNQ